MGARLSGVTCDRCGIWSGGGRTLNWTRVVGKKRNLDYCSELCYAVGYVAKTKQERQLAILLYDETKVFRHGPKIGKKS